MVSINSLLGGILIGVAASLMLFFNGRVAGVNGILGGALGPKVGQDAGSWRFWFLFGLVGGGILLRIYYPQCLVQLAYGQPFDFILAGFLVGIGTLMGSGCTSGHGVCGLSRFSLRSLLATLTFITFGILSVILFKYLRGHL